MPTARAGVRVRVRSAGASIAPSTTEPCRFVHSTSSGKAAKMRRDGRRASASTSQSVAAKSGKANDCGRMTDATG